MKKRTFLMLFLCIMLLLFAGCKKELSESDAKDSIQESKEGSINDTKEEYVKGILTNNSFESEYLNLRFKLPGGYIMATKEDMEGMMDLGAAVLDIDKNLVDYTKVAIIYEMMVSSPSGSPNMILMAEKLRLKNMTEDQYLTALKAQLLNMAAINYTFDGETTEVEIVGKKYKKVSVKAEISSQKMLQDYMIKKEKDRIICFIVTYTAETKKEMETIMNGFSKY